MALRRNIGKICVAAAALGVVLSAGCGKNSNVINTAQERIVQSLRSIGVYERDNLPDDPAPTAEQIKGYFDIVGGAYRYVVNESRIDSENRQEYEKYKIARGDSISFMFDARIFTGGGFDALTTFYTNVKSRIGQLSNNNPDFDGLYWPTEPMRIKVGEDGRILKSLQEALISCRAGDEELTNEDDPAGDGEPVKIESDEVRIYLTPDIAFGNNTVLNVPRNSTVVFEITDIKIIKH